MRISDPEGAVTQFTSLRGRAQKMRDDAEALTSQRPPAPPQAPPDCCSGPTPSGEFKPRAIRSPQAKHLKGRTIRYSDTRLNPNGGSGKHTANMRPTGNNGDCDVVHLRQVANTPGSDGPCLTRWYNAAQAGDARYGSQMGSDTTDPETYRQLIIEVVENGEFNPRGDLVSHDLGESVGVTVGGREITTIAEVRDLPDNAHLVPITEDEREV